MDETNSTQQARQIIYIVMTDILDEAVEAQARGNVAQAAALSEQASILGVAAGILDQRAE